MRTVSYKVVHNFFTDFHRQRKSKTKRESDDNPIKSAKVNWLRTQFTHSFQLQIVWFWKSLSQTIYIYIYIVLYAGLPNIYKACPICSWPSIAFVCRWGGMLGWCCKVLVCATLGLILLSVYTLWFQLQSCSSETIT